MRNALVTVLFSIILVATTASASGNDKVAFEDARRKDGSLVQAASTHELKYYVWGLGQPLDARRLRLHDDRIRLMSRGINTSALFVSMSAPQPGTYTLSFSDLTVHRFDENAGRRLAVYVVPEATPRTIISKLLPDGDSSSPRDYDLQLHIGKESIKDGRVQLMLQATTWGACYFRKINLSGDNSSDEVDFRKARTSPDEFEEVVESHRIMYQEQPSENPLNVPWNFGRNGVGLGTRSAYGYLSFHLKPQGVGPHTVTLHGIRYPRNVLPGHPILDVNGTKVLSGSDRFSFDIDVSAKEYELQRVPVRVEPLIQDRVCLRGASLKPAGQLIRMKDPEELGEFEVWPVDIYSGFRETMLPPDVMSDQAQINLSGARNEWVHGCFMVGHYGDTASEDLNVEFKLNDFEGPDGQSLSWDDFRIQVRQLVRSSNATQERAWEGLRDQDHVRVPHGKPRQIWITYRIPKHLPAGQYQGTIAFHYQGKEQQLGVTLRVYDFELPDESPLAVNCWLNMTWPTGTDRRYFYEDFRQHYGNVTGAIIDRGFIGMEYDEAGAAQERIDTDRLRRVLNEARDLGMRYFLAEFHRDSDHLKTMRWLGSKNQVAVPDLEYGSNAYKNVLSKILNAMEVEMQKAGFSAKNWFMYPYDEYVGPDFVSAGQLIRGSNTAVQIFANRSNDRDEMLAAAPYIDLWCPHIFHVENDESGERMAIMKESGKPIWQYSATAYRKIPSLPFRYQSWVAFMHNLDGIGAYKYVGDFSGLVGYVSEVGQSEDLYGPVMWSPRLFAWTDGIEDHMYLTILQRYCERNPGSDKANEIRELLDHAAKEISENKDVPGVYLKWHQLMGERIESLGMSGLEVE